ncbi:MULTISPECIES: glycosyltransferase [Alphaproteobacteria]|uniref:Glycosyltransferase 2-like domain-containing protein n=2 Tax=Alphaproteobacteria TaxID=28211 RepID=A0A512HEK8_9HYPH|nr:MULTISPECIES: glycosyltransferase [Alphaproteobacteria]GEO83888.1 hypothetical protein RNA01_08200 [Ciceribacter naphthalenivorans]GLR21234.1 hypothetical protein GCM10007920_10200 [Ciceribacter naphthalenivorans]GLT04090.1 hypothetical protein GCM10007926_10200 [Sphingomonas psychrolutea]
MLTSKNVLLCIFSYNMGTALERCIQSTFKMCPGFDVAVIDDQSEDPVTRAIIEKYRPRLKLCVASTEDKEGRRHGNLYRNIQRMCGYAQDEGYEFIFLIQDDMQFVRPFDEPMQKQYGQLFASDDKVLQVDPRFLRKGYPYEILEKVRAYRFPDGDNRRSYADVGILRLSTLKGLGWVFRESESANKKDLAQLGYVRLFPFSPVVMHVPFPKTYRSGRRKRSLLPLRRGAYEFHEMTDREQEEMDRRDLHDIPYFRRYLRTKGMLLARLVYAMVTDASALR